MVKIMWVDKSEYTRPKDGECFIDRYWVVNDKEQIAFTEYEGKPESPQCNHNEILVSSIRDSLYPDCKVEFIPVVYTGRIREF